MQFADLELSKRLECAEGRACVEFADARRRLFPDSGTEWIECGGAYAVFDGVDSPITQTFGLGICEELTAANLDRIEKFFFDRGASVDHEVSPHAGVAALNLLCERGYRPIELSNVMYRLVDAPLTPPPANIRVRVIDESDAALLSDISARGWAHDHPEFFDFFKAIRRHRVCAKKRTELSCRSGWPTRGGGRVMHSRRCRAVRRIGDHSRIAPARTAIGPAE